MPDKRDPMFRAVWLMLVILLIAVAGAAVNVVAYAATPPAPDGSRRAGPAEPQALALQRASNATVGVRALALEDAASNLALGRTRAGSGVVIDGDGVVLTIGYLIVEADRVELVLDDQRVVPARVLAYDIATGLGLLQALAPLRLAPVPLGNAAAIAVGEPLMVAGGAAIGVAGSLGMAQLIARRGFAGHWEYHVDDALFTAPARTGHSGAGLFNAAGELVGIGSLLLTHALGDDQPRHPGNMFVPIDLLPPILDELRRDGRSAASRRAWLGLNCVELAGTVRVLRVNVDGPAEQAGLQPGDRIVRIDGRAVDALEMLWKALWSGGASEREVTLEIERNGALQTLTLHSIDRATTLRRAQGI